MISDGPIVAAALFLVGQLSLRTQAALQVAGGCLLLTFAWTTLRQWRHAGERRSPDSTPKTLAEAVVVNLLNPHPYLSWTLILGPAVHAAWQRHPTHAIALVSSFYLTLVATLAGFVVVIGAAERVGEVGRRRLLGISGALLAGLGIYLVVRGSLALLAG